MLNSLAESPNITLGSVIHITDKPVTLVDDPNFTADSSLFISNPNQSHTASESAFEEELASESKDASIPEIEHELTQDNSIHHKLLQLLRKSNNSEIQEDIDELEELNGFSGLRLTANETDLKHLDETGTENIHESRSDNEYPATLSGSETESPVLRSSPVRVPSTSENSPFETPSRKPKSNVQFSPPSASIHSESGSEFQSSSFLDDTRAQFDLDINIDEYQVNTKQRQRSPWRNFRSSSPGQNPLRQASVFSRRNFSEVSTAGVASTEKIEDLSKQLTNCKIQLKLYEKFLQDLIDTQSINFEEVSTFHLNLDHNTDSQKTVKSVNPSMLKDVSPDKELLEMASLLEDLYASLEEYQNKWRDADGKVSVLDSAILAFAKDIPAVLQKLGIDTLAIDGIETIDSPKVYFDQVLQLLRDASLGMSQSPVRLGPDSPRIILGGVDLQRFSPSRLPMRKLPDYDFGSMTSTPRRSEREAVAHDSIDNKLQEYQAMIDRLQKEVNELKDQSRVGSVSDLTEHTFYSHGSRDREKYLLLQKDYDNLQVAHHDLIDEHHRYKNSLERTIASLKNQSESLQKDKLTLRSELAAIGSVQHDLEVSVEKQRVLTTEKIKLSYQVEALTLDKTTLQHNIEKLTERLATASEKSAPTFEALRKKASDAAELVDRLFEVDVGEYEKLLKSFNKIADDDSLEAPRKKIGFMVPVKNSGLLDQPSKVIAGVEEAHKSVLHFFSRAVEVIVNDHIRLLLKESEQKESHDVYVEELKGQIRELQERNKLTRDRTDVVPSPRLKLRIEELTNRWKAEREARILENRQAKKRLQELGMEKQTGK